MGVHKVLNEEVRNTQDQPRLHDLNPRRNPNLLKKIIHIENPTGKLMGSENILQLALNTIIPRLEIPKRPQNVRWDNPLLGLLNNPLYILRKLEREAEIRELIAKRNELRVVVTTSDRTLKVRKKPRKARGDSH